MTPPPPISPPPVWASHSGKAADHPLAPRETLKQVFWFDLDQLAIPPCSGGQSVVQVDGKEVAASPAPAHRWVEVLTAGTRPDRAGRCPAGPAFGVPVLPSSPPLP